MPVVRSLVQHFLTSEPSADWAVNTVYHTIDDAGFNPAVDYTNHAKQVLDSFSNAATAPHQGFNTYQGRKIVVTVYNMADPKPRPEKAQAIYTPATMDGANTYYPHQVATRLSWYAGRNLKGLRGGIYIGPLPMGTMTGNLVSSALQDALLVLGHCMFDVGGENVAHVLRHEATGATSVMTDYWVDNSPDVIRRRKQKSTGRKVLHP